MPRRLRRTLLTATLLGVTLAAAAGQTEREIEYLLEYVAHSGCTFLRNGAEHDPAGAADHLRLKYDRGKHHVNSAEQFIERLASKSSWTGARYMVTCDGQTRGSGPWLDQALSDYRQRAPLN